MFKEGRSSPHEEQRFGCRPFDVLNKKPIACVHALLDKDRRYTVFDIHWKMTDKYLNVVSRSTGQSIVGVLQL